MIRIYITIIMFCLSLSAWAQQAEEASRRRNFNHENTIGIGEFDPVSYFKNAPAKGDSKISHKHKGILYHFISEENREEFKKSPSKYEPAYGGWCAYHMALNGDRTRVNCSTYKIVNGRLYLFSNFNGKNTLLLWNKDEKKFKAAADRNWVSKMH
jgi:YHS domain-containing protein